MTADAGNVGSIVYPYLPEGRNIFYVPADNPFILAAREYARRESLDATMPCAAVVVAAGRIIGAGANGSNYHETNPCQRVILGCKSGEGYDLCEGCHPRNHAEPSAILNAQTRDYDVDGADLYLWGHWWCCEACWDTMIAEGVRDVYLMAGSHELFDRAHPNNIIGRQFV